MRKLALIVNPSAAGGRATAALESVQATLAGHGLEQRPLVAALRHPQADRAAAADQVRQVTARIATETGLRLEPGKLVEELRPEPARRQMPAAALRQSRYVRGADRPGQHAGDQGHGDQRW